MKKGQSIRIYSRFLPLGQLMFVAAMLLVAWTNPYTLQPVPFDWGRMTVEYGRNPAIAWLTLGQVPFLLLWIAVAKSKTVLQWVAVSVATGITIAAWLFLNEPPPFLG